MSIESGGPAFPTDSTPLGPTAYHHEGMTLRDYFAAKVMNRFSDCLEFHADQERYDLVAVSAYRMADAMLKAKGGTQ